MKDLLTTTVITSFDIDRRRGYLLDRDQPEFANLSLVEVARATSAAPTYFSPILVLFNERGESSREHYLADGGLWKNNPSLLAYIKAKEKFGNKEIARRGVVILSIGTGKFLGPLDFGWVGSKTKASVNTAIDISSYEDENVLKEIIEQMPHSTLIRIQPNLDNNKYRSFEKIDDVSAANINRLLSAAKDAKNTPEYQKAINFFKAP